VRWHIEQYQEPLDQYRFCSHIARHQLRIPHKRGGEPRTNGVKQSGVTRQIETGIDQSSLIEPQFLCSGQPSWQNEWDTARMKH